MRAATLFAVLAAALTGCGPGKELPDASQQRPPGPQADPAPAAPPASQDPARRMADEALRATSGGQPDRIAKVKAFRSAAKGVMQRPVAGQSLGLETTREFDAAWPNACRMRLDSQSLKPFTVGLNRPAVWAREGDQLLTLPDPRRDEENAAIEAVGQNWMLYLVPLAQPKTVVFDASSLTLGGKSIDSLKASVPGYPVFTLTFTDAHLLSRVEYATGERGGLVLHAVHLADHKAFDGLMLPTRVEVVRNGNRTELWSMTKWEVVEKVDEKIFEQPK